MADVAYILKGGPADGKILYNLTPGFTITVPKVFMNAVCSVHIYKATTEVFKGMIVYK